MQSIQSALLTHTAKYFDSFQEKWAVPIRGYTWRWKKALPRSPRHSYSQPLTKHLLEHGKEISKMTGFYLEGKRSTLILRSHVFME